jgi:hypothetical protein
MFGSGRTPATGTGKTFFCYAAQTCEGPKKGEYENYFFKTMMFSVAKFEII